MEVNSISELRDTFLAAKGFDSGESFSVSEEICNEFLDFIKINDNQAAMIFQKTNMQGNCNFWREQRCGRVTGSNFYRICHLKESTNTENTLKDLLGYCPLSAERQPIQFEWGHEKEESAIDLYCKKLKKVHNELCVCECGLIIDPELSYLGSSPDRIRSCSCCGKRVVEVKSLYSKRSLVPHIAAGDNIYKENGVYKLRKETKWNYQLQGEMALSKLTIGDLVIYTNKGIMVIEIEFDENLWHEMLVKLTKFYSKSMIPEILTRHIKNHLG